MADVHRSGRVGRDELDKDAFAGVGAVGPECLPGIQNLSERASEPGVGEKEIEKTRSRHLEALDARAEPTLQLSPQSLCHLARGSTHHRRQQQSGVGRVVAEVRARWTLQHNPPTGTGLARGLARQLSGGRQHGLT